MFNFNKHQPTQENLEIKFGQYAPPAEVINSQPTNNAAETADVSRGLEASGWDNPSIEAAPVLSPQAAELGSLALPGLVETTDPTHELVGASHE